MLFRSGEGIFHILSKSMHVSEDNTVVYGDDKATRERLQMLDESGMRRLVIKRVACLVGAELRRPPLLAAVGRRPAQLSQPSSRPLRTLALAIAPLAWSAFRSLRVWTRIHSLAWPSRVFRTLIVAF